MKKTILYTLIGATALASISTMALAHEKGKDGKRGDRGHRIERLMERIDTNKDGNITLEEIKTEQANIFAKIDSDQSGFATEEEFTAHKELMKAEREAKRAEKMAEREASQTIGDDEKRKMADKDGKRKKGKFGKRGLSFERLDADSDGQVTLAEFTGLADKMFERMDRNDDGVVNKDDFSKGKRG